MKKQVLIIAPHPDDEVLGCGGTILKHIEQGDKVHWLIITDMQERYGFTSLQVKKREQEINDVAAAFSFSSVSNLKFCPAGLDNVPMKDLVKEIGNVIKLIQPNILYLPYKADIHSDHAVVFNASISCSKWFRFPSIKKILVYETLSETDFNIDPDSNGFRPNVFHDITKFFPQKLDIIKIYESEFGKHPFPRSENNLKALATLRGASAGCEMAEAFMLIKEIVSNEL